jgi:hypothetical protein
LCNEFKVISLYFVVLEFIEKRFYGGEGEERCTGLMIKCIPLVLTDPHGSN